jgi:hypothetical protein
MSALLLVLIIVAAFVVLLVVALCRAAARGDRMWDEARQRAEWEERAERDLYPWRPR